jgi:hypothetical protein
VSWVWRLKNIGEVPHRRVEVEAAMSFLSGWSATLPLPDYGRVARHPPRIEGKHFVAPPNCLYSGRFNQPLGLELESYFFNSTDQLRTKLSGAGVFR